MCAEYLYRYYKLHYERLLDDQAKNIGDHLKVMQISVWSLYLPKES